METAALSSSAVNTLWRYFQERWTLRIAALVLLLVLASLIVIPTSAGLEWLERMFIACLLVFQFRLCDDLQDIERDRKLHPDRVTVTAQKRLPFYVALNMSVLGTATWLLLKASPFVIAIYAALWLVLGVWYHGLRARIEPIWPRMSILVIHLKYPVFVWLLAPVFGPPGPIVRFALAATSLYVGLCSYEWFEDMGGSS